MGQSRKRAAIQLRQAEAKYTRSKVGHDGSALAEAKYQRAKRQLRTARQVMRQHKPPHIQAGDATATPQSLQATTTHTKES